MKQENTRFSGERIILYFAVSIFAIFIGSQITEGVLLVPYWQSLSSSDFYSYYEQFGPSIGKFYTVLTLLALAIPIVFSYYIKSGNAIALRFALLSTFFALLFVGAFFIYFKNTNTLFYEGTLNDNELQKELTVWSYWHWGRILLECLSLSFLIIAIVKYQSRQRP